MTGKTIKLLGIGATVAGIGAQLLSTFVESKNTETKIQKAVAEAIEAAKKEG